MIWPCKRARPPGSTSNYVNVPIVCCCISSTHARVTPTYGAGSERPGRETRTVATKKQSKQTWQTANIAAITEMSATRQHKECGTGLRKRNYSTGRPTHDASLSAKLWNERAGWLLMLELFLYQTSAGLFQRTIYIYLLSMSSASPAVFAGHCPKNTSNAKQKSATHQKGSSRCLS